MAETGNPPRIVVYGGIGSGKSTLAALLGGYGAIVIEADRIGHQVIQSGGAAFDTVSARWPQSVVAGQIDRSILGAIVFAHVDQLRELEAITHPLIAAEIVRLAAAAGSAAVVVELPLTKVSLDDRWVWVLVDAPSDIRMQRAVARGADPSDVSARMAAQPDDDEWHGRADWIVPNTGSLEALAAAAAELWENLNRS